MEEGISFVENLEPVEAVGDENGHLAAIRFRRSLGGDVVEIPARSCRVAAGTTPNITYEKEKPGTFPMDERRRFFLPHRAESDGRGGWKLIASSATDETAFFTGYARQGRFITIFGDNHPAYNGNVVKAMASARRGYLPITQVLLGDAPERPVAPEEEWEE